MTQMAVNQARESEGDAEAASVADELKQEIAQLQQLAAKLKACEEAEAEMRANYPHLKQAVYATLREHFERELAPLPDKDLQSLAVEEGALPLEAFIAELEKTAERP